MSECLVSAVRKTLLETPIRIPLLESILLIVFGAAIIPVVCVAAPNFDTVPSVAWRIGNLLQVLVAVVWFGAVVPRLLQTQYGPTWSKLVPAFVYGTSGANGIAQALYALDGFSPHVFAVMFAGLAWYFVSGAIAFSRILTSEDAA